MTHSFKNKLGQGGYGSVYKGKLLDNRLVAVKVINDLKGDGEDFINEVAIISRTSHVNIVTLLVGIARGLEYLHRGCSTRILHFDIKPQNILLDDNFCPKISDFGLARLCQKKESIVSMLGTRGTIGYIAPEVFSRSFGGVSHKSDVYSYGMLILEMVGVNKNLDAKVSHTIERYFPNWIYQNLNLCENVENNMVIIEEEEQMKKKMILVGLWCIQTIPTNRPSMTKVVEMLEGNVHSIEIPPKPFLFSPARSVQYSSTTSLP
uniref:Protein kinase domain-containing protein n=1 Tax=Quercus lobata TaxID=97700 RepID=A0A7N2KKN7_QUELO